MNFTNKTYNLDFKIFFTNTDDNLLLTNNSFLLFMENTAEEHLRNFNCSFEHLFEQNLSWIILNWNLNVIKRPKLGEIITVKTNIINIKKFFVYREFQIIDKNNSLLATAIACWALVNTQTRKLVIPNNCLPILDQLITKNNILPKINNILPKGFLIKNTKYTIHKFDLDINKHVHNLNYLNFAYELLPKINFNYLNIHYKHELILNDKIDILLYKENDMYIIIIKNKDVISAVINLK